MRSCLQDLLVSIVSALLLMFVATPATAQAVPTATGPGATIVAGVGGSLFYSPYSQRNLCGAHLFVDVQPHWRFGVEAEARYLRLHTSEELTEKNYLAGPRVLIRSGRYQPYAKFLIGDGHIEVPFNYAHGDFLALVPGVGLDLTVNDYINIRVFDVEYQLWHDFPFGNMSPYGVSAGVSVRVTRIVRFPSGSRARS
jgi:hypothetical protein